MKDNNQLPPSEREAFEAFAQNCPMGKYSIGRRGYGYDSSHTQLMWDAWQARAILALRPAVVQMTYEQRRLAFLASRAGHGHTAFMLGISASEAHHGIKPKEQA